MVGIFFLLASLCVSVSTCFVVRRLLGIAIYSVVILECDIEFIRDPLQPSISRPQL